MLEKTRSQVFGVVFLFLFLFFLQILTAILASAMVSVKCSSKLYSGNSPSTSAASASLRKHYFFSFGPPGLQVVVLLYTYYSPGNLPQECLQLSSTL